eukprot:g19277.t1
MCATRAKKLEVAREERIKAACDLGNALEPFVQVLKGGGKGLTAGTLKYETYLQCTGNLKNAVLNEELIRDNLASTYPQEVVVKALQAVYDEMQSAILEAKAMAQLVDRLEGELQGWSLAETLPKDMETIYKSQRTDIKAIARTVRSLQNDMESLQADINDAEDDEERKGLKATAEGLQQKLGRKQEELAERHKKFRRDWDNVASRALRYRPELFLPLYWSRVQSKEIPAWARFWMGQFDTCGLERTDLSFRSYSDAKRIDGQTSRHLVYSAERGKRVALKVFTVEERDKGRLLKEARLLQKLGSHPHIVSVNLTFWDPQREEVYLEMPWYEATTE